MKIVKAYKVIERLNGKLLSYLNGPARIEYKPNEWVTPLEGCGPLIVFKTVKNAKEFLYPHPNKTMHDFLMEISLAEIWECEAQVWSKKLPRDERGKTIALWSNNLSKRFLMSALSRGVFLCEAVKLIKRVWP